MSNIISQRELRNDNGEIMRRLDQGETFLITRNGHLVGELAPLHRSRFVSSIAFTAMFANAPQIDAKQFREDVDAFVDQDLAPRV